MAFESNTLRMVSEARPEYGSARIREAGPVTAGEYGTWQFVYRVGESGLGTEGQVRVFTDSDADCGWPQVSDPSAADYMTLQVPEDAEISLRMMDHISLTMVNTGRRLEPGEEIGVTYGDCSGGGPGARSQTFVEELRYFWVDVDPEGRGEFAPLPDPPVLNIRGGDAARLVVVAPSDAVVDELFRVLIKAEDEWGNPAQRYRGRVSLEAVGIDMPETDVEFGEANGGTCVVEGCRVTEAGQFRISASDADKGLTAESNPVIAREEAPTYRLFWGDPHGGQVVDPRKIRDFFAYARDMAGIDFAGFQRNDNAMASEAYDMQQEYEKEHYEPGRFVPLPGFEWSGEPEQGGHHNVYFRRFDQPIRRCGHSEKLDPYDVDTDLSHVLELYQNYRHSDVVITPHVGGTHADLQYHEPELEPAVEVTSTHGTFEWFLRETLERRYKVGFVGGRDCYTGRPGDDHPGFQTQRYAKAGLAGVYAEELTLESILAGLKARRCYATTGVRIVAMVSADGHMMGSEYSTPILPEINVSISGTAPLARVELYRGLDLIHAEEMSPGSTPNRVRILWEGASRKSSYSGVVWDGFVQVSGGRVASVEKMRFDSPRSHLEDESVTGLRWQAWTCGYKSGLLLEIDGPPQSRIVTGVASSVINGARYGGHGEAPPHRMSFAPADRVRFDVKLADLASGPRAIDLGILDRKFSIGLAPEPGPRRVDFSFRDPSPSPGINPYWVRVIQSDMEMAWTSPVFADYPPDPRKS